MTKLPETSPAEVPAFALPYVVNALPMSTAATGYRSMAAPAADVRAYVWKYPCRINEADERPDARKQNSVDIVRQLGSATWI